MARKDSERGEAIVRIGVAIVTGIILALWRYLIFILAVVNWIVVIFTGKRNKDMAVLCEYWNSEVYRYIKYMTFVTNERPFPFTSLKTFGKFEK